MSSLIAGGLFNAVAFAGAGFLFQKLNKRGYEEEIKRYNKALEDLAQAREKFYEDETKRRNKEAALKQEIVDAKEDGKVSAQALRS